MAKERTYNMTKGNEVKLLLKFSIPMLIGNLFQQVYNMVDSIVVGQKVGADALAAVGTSGSLHFLFFSLCMGLGSGVGILASQYFGAEQEANVKKTVGNAIYLIGISGILMSICGVIFAREALLLLNTPEKILEDAVSYMRIVCFGLLSVAVYNGVSSVLRALGDSKTPLIFLIVSSIINAGLDLLFVCVWNMGVEGAAYATLISQVICAVSCCIYAVHKNSYFRLKRSDCKIDRMIIGKSVKMGFPIAAQAALIAISCVALQGAVNKFGEGVMAAYTATNRIEQLVQQPFGSLGTAVSTFTGQNIGAGERERVKKGYQKSVIMVAIFSLLMLVVIQLFGTPIMRLFLDSKETGVIEFGTKALRITSMFYFGLGMIYVTRGMLNGIGDASFAMMAGLVEVIGRVVFSLVLVAIPFIGVWGIWGTNGLTWAMTALFCYTRYRQGKWKKISLISVSPPAVPKKI